MLVTNSPPLIYGYNVRENGAVANAKRVADAAIGTGTAALTSATAGFTAADVGKSIWVAGAGAAGAWLTTTISAYISATQVTLAANAGTTVSGANAAFGTDDSSKILATVNKAIAAGVNSVWIPGGDYFVDTVAIAKVGLTINGEKGATRIHSSTGANCFVATTISPESMAIRNIEFYGRGKNDAVGGSAIWFHDFGVESPGVVFADLYIHDWSGSAIKIGNPRSAYVAGNNLWSVHFLNLFTKNCGGNHIDIANAAPAATFTNWLYIDVAPGKWALYAESITATLICANGQDNTRPANGADADGGGGIFINTTAGVSTLLIQNSNFEAYGIDAIKITGPCQLTVQGTTFLDTSILPSGGVKRTAINITSAQTLPTLLTGCQFNSTIGFKNAEPIHCVTSSNLQVIGPSPTTYWSDVDAISIRYAGMRLGYGFFAGNYTNYPHFDYIGIGNSPKVVINSTSFYSDTGIPNGSYLKGDVIWDQNQASSYAGWICTVAGTQATGTFVHFGPREFAAQNFGNAISVVSAVGTVPASLTIQNTEVVNQACAAQITFTTARTGHAGSYRFGIGEQGFRSITLFDVTNSRVLFDVDENGNMALGCSTGKHGFYGSAGAVKPTVTGSRGANAALASLLTALASLGLLTDSST